MSKLTKKKQSIYDEAWCKDLISRLGKVKEHESRLEIIETTLEKATGPKNKLVATYTPAAGTIKELETEHFQISCEIKVLNSALKALEKMDCDIIELSFIDKVNKWHITEVHIPNKYTDSKGRPLYISGNQLGYRKSRSLKIMAKNLGYFSDNSKVSNLPELGSYTCPKDMKIY